MTHGWLNLYKPQGMTSFSALHRVRRLLGVEKVGHAGTLDPFAEGVLPLAIGEATKTLSFCMNKTKTYTFSMKWGQKTDTGDLTGAIIEESANPIPDQVVVQSVLSQFIGGYNQMPPLYSALKVQGKRACDRVRRGEEVQLKPRFVHIESLEILHHDATHTQLSVTCGPGTYVRSLAEDIAAACGHIAHVQTLRRDQSGIFSIKDAILLEKLENIRHKVVSTQAWVPTIAVLDDIPAICLNAVFEQELRYGRCITAKDVGWDPHFTGTALCVNVAKEPVALVLCEEGQIFPKRVFHTHK